MNQKRSALLIMLISHPSIEGKEISCYFCEHMVRGQFSLFQRAPTLAWLLGLNVGLYGVLVVLALFSRMSGQEGFFVWLYHKLALPAHLSELARQPWSVLTHMFVHDVRSFWHILFNMLWLYWMGRLFTTVQPERRLGWIYMLAGLAGVVGYLVYALSKGVGGYALGASAAVNGIILATVALMPNYGVFLFFIGPIALRWVGLIWVFLDFVTALTNEAVAVAHLSGSVAGMVIGYALRQGWKPESIFKAIREYFEGPEEISQEEIDRILEKIHAKGMKSLTRRELRILQRATEKL